MIEKEQIKTVKKYRFLSYLKHGLLQLPLLPGNPVQNAVLQNLQKIFSCSNKYGINVLIDISNAHLHVHVKCAWTEIKKRGWIPPRQPALDYNTVL